MLFFLLLFFSLQEKMLLFEIGVLTGRVPIALFLFIGPAAENHGMNKNLQ